MATQLFPIMLPMHRAVLVHMNSYLRVKHSVGPVLREYCNGSVSGSAQWGGNCLLPTPSASKSYVVEVHVSLLPVGIDLCRFKAWPENHV